MHNLLWKFVALAGVMGIGFMVVLQAMDGLSVPPKLGPDRAASASQDSPEADPSAREPFPDLPPLKTKETVVLADSFAPRPRSQGASEAVPFAPDVDPFPAGSFPDSLESLPDSGDFGPSEFPATPPSPPQPAPEDLSPEPALPALPMLSPLNGPADVPTPNPEAFSEEEAEPSPFSDPPILSPPAGTSPGGAEDPFADPLPLSERKPRESEENPIPFDPYEPLPESVADKPSNRDDQPESPMFFPSAEDTPDAAAAVENPLPASPDAAVSERAANADNSPTDTQPRPKPDDSDLFKPFPLLPQAETSVDPLDLNPPRPSPAPGRASVQNPKPPSAEERPVAFPPELSEAPPSLGESASPRGKPLPDITLPFGPGLENGLPTKWPECAIPSLANAEVPPSAGASPFPTEPFVDPLDQLTVPGAAPPEGNGPQHSLAFPGGPPLQNPPSAMEPRPVGDSSPEISPRPLREQPADSSFPVNPDVTQVSSDLTGTPSTAVEAPESQPTPSTPLDGVGMLESSAPSGPQQPELKIEKTAPPKAALGQPMIYHILVRNVGQSAAHEVIVEDQIPKGTQLTGTIPRGEMADNRLIWRLGEIQPGEEKKIAVRVIPTQEGQIGSVAKVSFVAEVAARTVVAAAKLALEFTGPANAVVGDAVTYHFKIANTGSGDATQVYLRNLLPEGLNHPDGNDLEYDVGTLKAGEIKEVDLTVNATLAGEFTNKAIISASGGVQTEASTKVKIIGDRLTITRTGPKRRYVGRTVTFANTIANQSESKVSPIRVVEAVPAGMDFVEASAGGKFDPQTRTVTWAIRELAPQETQLLKLDLMAREEGPQSSEVTAYDPNGMRAVVKSETTIEGYASLRLDVHEYAEPVDVGEQVGLRMVATNRGTRATSKVVVRLTLPEEMEFVSARGPVDFKRDGATLTFNPVDSLDAGEELKFDLVLKSIKAGDARVRMEISSEQMTKPLAREEGVRILATRP